MKLHQSAPTRNSGFYVIPKKSLQKDYRTNKLYEVAAPNLDRRRCKLTASVSESPGCDARENGESFLSSAILALFMYGDGAEGFQFSAATVQTAARLNWFFSQIVQTLVRNQV